MKGKTIRLYLVDGIPTGVLTAEIINWTGKVIVAPRSQMVDLMKRDEVRRTGIYFLVGADPEEPSRDRVYVGEADSVVVRLTSHDKDESKDFWSRTIVVISKDENLTKSHGRYLESRLIDLTNLAGRASLANGTNPETTPLPEPDIADMEFFIEQIQMILPVLGFSFLQPRPAVRDISSNGGTSPRFVITNVGTHATAVEVDGELVVLEGSTARRQGVESWTSYRSLRDQLVADHKLIDSGDPDFYTFADDVSFASPSAAAAVILARNTNGRMTWRIDGSGQTYQEWHEARVATTVAE